MIIVKAVPGEDVTAFAKRLLTEAWVHGQTVYGEFNLYTFEARPGSTIPEIMAPYLDATRKSFFW